MIGHALIDQLGGRDDDAFLEDVRCIRRDRTRPDAADIGEMRPAHHKGAAPVAQKHRGQKHLIIRMRDGAFAAVAVIIPIEITRPDGLDRKPLKHRAADIAKDRHVRTHRHHAISVEQGGVEILLLANKGRDRGALQQRFHLGLCRPDGAPDDFQDDGIASCHDGTPSRWQATLRPGEIMRRAGVSSRQRATAWRQRSWNAQPAPVRGASERLPRMGRAERS